MKQLTEKQKEVVVKRLNNNPMFNKFGLVNIASLRGTNPILHQVSTEPLKKFIRERFDDEVINGVQFMDEQEGE